MLGLEILEKFAWTTIDYLIRRPKFFFQNRMEKPEKYMAPFPFAVAHFFIYESVLVATIKLLAPIWDWNIVTSTPLKISEDIQLPTLFAATGAGTLLCLLFFVIWFKLGAWIVRKKIAIDSLLVAFCYSFSLSIITIIYMGLCMFVGFILSPVVADMNQIGKGLYNGTIIIGLLMFPYFISSVAAIGNINFWRLFLGVFLIYIIPIMILIILNIVILIMKNF